MPNPSFNAKPGSIAVFFQRHRERALILRLGHKMRYSVLDALRDEAQQSRAVGWGEERTPTFPTKKLS